MLGGIIVISSLTRRSDGDGTQDGGIFYGKRHL